MNSQTSMSSQANPAQELRRLEQMQTNLFLNINLVLKRDIEEYLNKQEEILNEEGGIKKEVVDEVISMFMEFAKNIILHQERVQKIKNKEQITARDVDDQITQVRLFNWWATQQTKLMFKLKRLYHLQRSKEYEE